MSAINGKLWVFMDGSTVIGATTEASLNIDQDTEEVQTKSTPDEFKRRIETSKDWSFEFSGLFDPSETYNFEEVVDLILGSSNNISWKFQPTTPVADDILLSGDGIWKNIKIDANNQSPIGISGSIEGNSALVKDVSTGTYFPFTFPATLT